MENSWGAERCHPGHATSTTWLLCHLKLSDDPCCTVVSSISLSNVIFKKVHTTSCSLMVSWARHYAIIWELVRTLAVGKGLFSICFFISLYLKSIAAISTCDGLEVTCTNLWHHNALLSWPPRGQLVFTAQCDCQHSSPVLMEQVLHNQPCRHWALSLEPAGWVSMVNPENVAYVDWTYLFDCRRIYA